MHGFHNGQAPLALSDAVSIWHARLTYLNALIYVRGNELAKEVELGASPGDRPLAICLGSAKHETVKTLLGEHVNARLRRLSQNVPRPTARTRTTLAARVSRVSSSTNEQPEGGDRSFAAPSGHHRCRQSSERAGASAPAMTNKTSSQ